MKKPLTIIIFLLSILSVRAQSLIKGKVYDAQTKEAVAGAGIRAKGSEKGTITDNTGSFSLQSEAKELIVSMIGYQTRTLPVSINAPMSIALETAIEDLQTVVVTGNREASLRTQTPIAISKLSPKQIEEAKPIAIYEVINKIPGVMMVNLNNEQHMMAIRQPMTTNAYYLYSSRPAHIRNGYVL